jgi:hypothetical protein
LRRLPPLDQAFLIDAVHDHFEASGYAFLPADTAVIPGHEEALYGYMAVVVAMEDAAVGVLDMGGASKQLSYVLDPAVLQRAEEQAVLLAADVEGGSVLLDPEASGVGAGVCVPDYMLQLPGTSTPTGLVARSMQGLGLLAAMDLILDLYVTRGEDGSTSVLPQPCLAVGATERGMVWYGVVWYGMVWYGMVGFSWARFAHCPDLFFILSCAVLSWSVMWSIVCGVWCVECVEGSVHVICCVM